MSDFIFGVASQNDCPVTQLGDEPTLLADIAKGKGDAAKALKEAKNPVIIVGAGALARGDGKAVLTALKTAFDAVARHRPRNIACRATATDANVNKAISAQGLLDCRCIQSRCQANNSASATAGSSKAP